jgi:hypothetical protein
MFNHNYLIGLDVEQFCLSVGARICVFDAAACCCVHMKDPVKNIQVKITELKIKEFKGSLIFTSSDLYMSLKNITPELPKAPKATAVSFTLIAPFFAIRFSSRDFLNSFLFS